MENNKNEKNKNNNINKIEDNKKTKNNDKNNNNNNSTKNNISNSNNNPDEFVLYSDKNNNIDSESHSISKEEEEETLTYPEYFLECARFGDLAELKSLMQDKPSDFSPNYADERGNTSLHFACANGHLETIKFLIEVAGCDINVENKSKSTPLCWAALNGHKKVVEYLIEKGVDVNKKNECNKKASEIAFDNGYYDISELLIPKEINSVNNSINEEESNEDEVDEDNDKDSSNNEKNKPNNNDKSHK